MMTREEKRPTTELKVNGTPTTALWERIDSNGSTRDLFFDCEEELFMSGEDSSDEEHTGELRFFRFEVGFNHS